MRTIREMQQAISLRLRELRDKVELSQKFVGESLGGYTKQSIGKWEDPEASALPSLVYVAELCRLYKCTPETLLCLDQSSSYAPLITYNRLTSYEGIGFTWILDQARLDTYSTNLNVREGVELFHIISDPNQSFEKSPFAKMLDKHLEEILSLVLRAGIVRIQEVEPNEEEESALNDYFGRGTLLRCIVANAPPRFRDFMRPLYSELVACLALQPLIDTLQQVESFGITGGRMIGRLTELMPFGCLANKEAIALLNAKTWNSGTQLTTSANAFIARIAYKNPDLRPYFMPYVNPERRSAEHFRASQQTEQEELRLARDIRERARNVDLALVSLADVRSDFGRFGSTVRGAESRLLVAEMAHEDQRKIIGTLLFRLLDAEGNRVGTGEDQAKNDALVYSIELSDLREMVLGEKQKQVWLLTGSATKAQLVRTVIKNRYVNCLATTSEVAQQILKTVQ